MGAPPLGKALSSLAASNWSSDDHNDEDDTFGTMSNFQDLCHYDDGNNGDGYSDENLQVLALIQI